MNIGSNIKKIRESKNMTQKKLAEKTGLSEISIRKYESNNRKPKFENILKISKALGVSSNELTHEDSLTFKIIKTLQSILGNNSLECIEKNTNISIHLLNHIIENPYEDLSILEQQSLIKYLYLSNKDICKKFCEDHFFYGNSKIIPFMASITTNKNMKVKPVTVSMQYIIDRDAFYSIIKTRILDIANQYNIKIKEDDINNITSQIDNIMYNQLFKKHNKKPEFYDEIN